jgi:hypothetical protein
MIPCTPDDRFRTRFRDDGPPARCDVGQRLVPAHTLESRLAFPTGAFQRVKHAIRVIHALEVVIHFRAERAARKGMIGIAVQLLGHPVANIDDPAARIRTVVPAGAADGVHVVRSYCATTCRTRGCH